MALTVGDRLAPGDGGRRARAPSATTWQQGRPLAAVVALGAALRFSTLGAQSLWYDEAVTHSIVSQGLLHVLRAVPQTESTPPLYYVLTWLWTRLFGLGEVGLRSFSALCGTATILVMWQLGRRLVSARVGLIAALITAVNPFLFYYSQEARSYALLTLLSAWSLLALVRAVEQPLPRRLIAWGLTAAALLTVHYFAAFILVAEAAWLLFQLRGRLTRERVLMLFGPPAFLAVPLGLLAIHQNDGRARYIAGSGSIPYRLAQLGKQDLIGDGQPHKLLLAGVGVLVVLLAGALLMRRASATERAAAAMPAGIALAGIALAVVFSALGTDYLNSRNLLPTWPALALVAAIGLGVNGARRTGRAGAATLTALSLLCIATVVFDVNYQRDDWRGAAEALGRLSGPRAIVSDVYDSRAPLSVYLAGISDYASIGTSVHEVDVVWLNRGHLGHPVTTFPPRPLAGFSVKVDQRPEFVVVTYRAMRGTEPVLPPAALTALYPDAARSSVMLQR